MDNYLCNQCPSPQKLWVRILFIQHVLDAILYHNSRWFSSVSPVSSTNKIDSHDKVEILLKVASNTITLTHIRTNNIYFRTSSIWERTARSYPYGSGIYIYISTHCHSLFRLSVRFSHMVRCTRYILYYEKKLITVVLELLPLFWYIAHQKREKYFEFWSNFN
jgi:hypothetical protein